MIQHLIPRNQLASYNNVWIVQPLYKPCVRDNSKLNEKNDSKRWKQLGVIDIWTSKDKLA